MGYDGVSDGDGDMDDGVDGGLSIAGGCSSRTEHALPAPQLSPLCGSLQACTGCIGELGCGQRLAAMLCPAARRHSMEPCWRSNPRELGRAGLAWGLGLHGNPPFPGPIKREGDGRSPAGAFELSSAFGYAPRPRRKARQYDFRTSS